MNATLPIRKRLETERKLCAAEKIVQSVKRQSGNVPFFLDRTAPLRNARRLAQ